MAISYPISLPATPGFQSTEITPMTAVGMNRSPFTGQQQVYAWPAQSWQAAIGLPPMKDANAGKWAAALMSLNGPEGTFMLGPSIRKRPITPGQMTQDNNLITASVLNGSFETAGAGGADVFANWVESTSGGTLSRDTVDFISGGGAVASAKFYAGSSGFSKLASLAQTVLVVGRNYYYQFWAKVDVAGLSTVSIQNSGDVRAVVTLTNAWDFYSGTFTATSTSLEVVMTAIVNRTINLDVFILKDLSQPPQVNGGSQTGYDLATKLWQPSSSDLLKQGDWLQLGSGSTARLHMVMADITSDGSGHATITLWPRLRSSPADGDPITLVNPQGVFRLAQTVPLAYDSRKICAGMNFSAMEAL